MREKLRPSLPRELARLLIGVLSRYTSTPQRCWFAVWEGWGGLRLTLPRGLPTFKVPGRSYYLAAGPLSASLDPVDVIPHYRSASLWWPDDRAWCVATDVDFTWTYVGGTGDCIASIVEHPEIEALPARLSDGVTYASDRINPAPPRNPAETPKASADIGRSASSSSRVLAPEGLMDHPLHMRRIGIASEEWPVVIYGACLGITWTMGSLAWVFTSDYLFSVNTALDWLRVVLLLPALVSVTVGEALYRSGFGFEELGIAFGALLAALLCTVGLLVLARRS